MTTQKQYDWMFEPCDPEGKRNKDGIDFTHATRGAKPIPGLVEPDRVVGYGFSQERADEKAREKAKLLDAQREIDRKAGDVADKNIW